MCTPPGSARASRVDLLQRPSLAQLNVTQAKNLVAYEGGATGTTVTSSAVGLQISQKVALKMASTDHDYSEPTQGPSPLKRYKHPFTEDPEWGYYTLEDDDPTDKDTPRTLAELRMCALSAAIRAKPNWWMKFRDEEIRAKWREEIKEQEREMPRNLQLTDNMINYTMGELEAYAALRDPEAGIESGPYERIWQSDKLIPASLKAALVSAIAPLESMPDSQKDWHPGSDSKVLDVVHPSLYPVVYGRTAARDTQNFLQPRASDIAAMFRSERFQWLPSDFRVEADGAVRLLSPYINNIHPEDHRALTDVVPKVLEKAVPMFEWVLSDLARETQLPTYCNRDGSASKRPRPPLGAPPPFRMAMANNMVR
ncbi:uncharacterized protein C8Q71DRAFT_720028 [Rhodofomes roseus]|uniref:Uncharacterized protein n=1 Tax=Rhodofomes roseus TaxID=34475 RepID=A0ABQ8KW14_9APHY|nr:uncharacterized protein C8Q71DRAFT_720028 [Rhodofomes roseus]KAH9842485.1 hypothetical protein C8Q71DRAFT_720028 [Rhodofomes roseus]